MPKHDYAEIPFSIRFTTYYAVQEPDNNAHPSALLLALHGWGQKSSSFIRSLAPLKDSSILVVAPQGPHQFYLDAATKKVGCNWLTAYQREQSISDINNYIAALVGHIQAEYPIDSGRIWLMGFSQGVSMAYRFAVSGMVEPAGLIACCADIAPDVIEKLPTRKPFPVYLAHGKEDKLVPEIVLEANQTILRDAHYPHEVYRYDGGHEITPGLCEKIREWIG